MMVVKGAQSIKENQKKSKRADSIGIVYSLEDVAQNGRKRRF